MARYPFWTDKEISELKGYLRDGLTQTEIAELMGRSFNSITKYCQKHGLGSCKMKQKFPADVQAKIDKVKEMPETSQNSLPKNWNSFTPSAPAKEKTLKDFQARDMIKYLYDLGYRIEEGKLVCYVKQAVNVKDIINA